MSIIHVYEPTHEIPIEGKRSTIVMKNYDKKFYLNYQEIKEISAYEVLSIMFGVMEIHSIVDIGCGIGTWLKSGMNLGAETVLGVDGHWLDKEITVIDEKLIRIQDLERNIHLESTFDLAISLEVAEHLTESRADSFVKDLCALSDLILFSAAVPGQGGLNHINEQWQSYWAKKFQLQGYRAHDLVRWKLWSRSDIASWYRQNTIVYSRAGSMANKAIQSVSPFESDVDQLDVVHPEIFSLRKTKVRKKNGMRGLIRNLFVG